MNCFSYASFCNEKRDMKPHLASYPSGQLDPHSDRSGQEKIGRFQIHQFTVSLKGSAEWFGLEVARMAWVVNFA
jgi:hypothetical protein